MSSNNEKKLILGHGGDIYTPLVADNGHAVVDFSANINPLGMPNAVKQAIIDNMEAYLHYPDPLNRELRQAIGAVHNLPVENIACGNGAADIIFRIAYGLKPQSALIPAPTFSEYELALRAADCRIEHFLLDKEQDFIIDRSIGQAVDEATDIVFICNPNNPTGSLVSRETMAEIADKCLEKNAILVVDECFMDFVEDNHCYSLVPELNQHPNLIILKAFTKIYAMAGIRLGYALAADTQIIERINAAAQPWSVSVVAAKCGVAALSCADYPSRTRELITPNRQYLVRELTGLGIKVFDGKANYLLLQTDCCDLVERMKKYGLLIRSCNNYVGLGDGYFRIAVKNETDNRYLVECLQAELKR